MNESTPSQSHSQLFVITIAAVAAIGGLLFGFDTGVISGAILFIGKTFHLSAKMNGLVVSAVLFGACLGAAFSGRFADLLGRRRLLLITALVFMLSTIGTAYAPNVAWLTVGRIFVGFAIGVSSFVAPLYISEVAPPKFRGMLVTFNQLLVTIGIVTSYVVDYHFAADANWRMMLLAGVVPAICLLIGMLFLPQSPRWLVARGQLLKARHILKNIRSNRDVEAEINEIQASMHTEQGSWRLLLQRWLWPALVVGCGLAIFQQITGINTIIYYAPTIFKMAGFHNATSAIMATVGIGVLNVVFTIIALPLIDRLGRRPLLLIGLGGMILCLFALSWAFYADPHSAFLKWIALGSMMFYIPCFAISLGPIMWLMIAEIFPLKIRGFASSLTASVNWIFNMFVAFTFLTMIKDFGADGTFLIYGTIAILGFFFVLYFVPETKGISLEQIEANLRAGKPSRELGI